MPTHKKVDLGITLVPEGKHLFTEMTVHENLVMGAYRKEALKHVDESLELVACTYSFSCLKGESQAKSWVTKWGRTADGYYRPSPDDKAEADNVG